MSESVIILPAGSFAVSYASPALLLPPILNARGVRFVHFSLNPQISSGNDSEENYWHLQVRKEKESFYAAPKVVGRNPERVLLQGYSWLREKIKKNGACRIHSFGDGAITCIAAALAAEFRLEWLHTAPVPLSIKPIARCELLPVERIDWEELILEELLRDANEYRKVEMGFRFVVILPACRRITGSDLEFARSFRGDGKIIVIEPVSFEGVEEADLSPHEIHLFAPLSFKELVMLFFMADVCVVPQSGSWLTKLAEHAARALHFANPSDKPPEKISYMNLLKEKGGLL